MVHDPNQLLSLFGLCAAAVALSIFVLAPYLSAIGSIPKGQTLPGLRNWGNWCFCNSVLQSLSSLPTLKQWLNEHADAPDSALTISSEDEPCTLSRTLLGLLRLLSIEGPAKTLSSSPLISALERIQRVRISRDQQDAQEFLHLILESLAAEQNGLSHQASILQMAQAAKEAGKSYIRLPFEGILESTSTCGTCGLTPRSQQTPFLELTVLPRRQGRMTLEACLADVLKTEYIEDYHCAGCAVALMTRQAQTTADRKRADDLRLRLIQDPGADLPDPKPRVSSTLHRSVKVLSLPAVLAIHINRSLFDAYATRNDVAIEFGEKLDVSAVVGHSVTDASHIYQLRSFVTHKGSHNRGHYIAFRKRGRQWYMISDETIRLVTLEQALEHFQQSVFLLFYEQVDMAVQEERKKQKRKQKKRDRSTNEARLAAEEAIPMKAISKM